MRRPAKKRIDSCIVCGQAQTVQCMVCQVVYYCSYPCRKLHRRAGHKDACCPRPFKTHSVPLVKTVSSVIPPPPPALPGRPWSYQDFAALFNKRPLAALAYRPLGLTNSGNSCFLNVILQCLVLTPPLFALLTTERSHRSRCPNLGWCFLCEFESHILRSILNVSPICPAALRDGLPNIGGGFVAGRQEDAHELMRFALDAMHNSCLRESDKGGATVIDYTFAGQLRSEVKCCACGETSYRHEKMMDLAVEIGHDAEEYTLEECLDRFTECEYLDGDNKYKCEACDGYVRAAKGMRIGRAPNVLTVALKRFGGKLNRRVRFPAKLDLSKYVVGGGDDDVYKLYAVVVHSVLWEEDGGYCGHYICFTKDFRGNWFKINDRKVFRVDLEEVLSQQAYMLMYSRTRAHPNPSPLHPPPSDSDPQSSSGVPSESDPQSSSEVPTESDPQSSSGVPSESNPQSSGVEKRVN